MISPASDNASAFFASIAASAFMPASCKLPASLMSVSGSSSITRLIASGLSSMPGFSDFSPGLATARPSMIRRFVASIIVMAARRTFFQSSSVLGRRSSVPAFVTIVATDSQR